MLGLPTAEAILLRQRSIGRSQSAADATMTLRSKLDQLFDAGFEADDIFALVIPLLMQGKVRLDVGDVSERLELDDQDLRQTRPNAIGIFQDYLAVRDRGLAAA